MAGNRPNFPGADESHWPFRHFFKAIMAGAVQSKKLMLPEKFVRTFQNELYDEVQLELPNGRVWTVGLTRELGEPQVWLDSGFGDFLAFYSITQQAYLLMFKYNGFSSFQVVICDKSACEIAYPNPAPLPSSSDEEDEEEEESNDMDSGTKDTDEDYDSDTNLPEEDSDGATEDSQSSDDSEVGRSKGKGKRSAGRRNGASGSRRPPRHHNAATHFLETASGRDKDLWCRLLASKITVLTKFQVTFRKLSRVSKKGIEKAISCNKPQHPSVMVVMHKFNIHPGIMYLPMKFAKRYLPQRFRRDSAACL